MAEARRFADLPYGHAGQLTYIPRQDRSAGEPGALHTSHLTSNCPHFQQIGSTAELYAASKSELPQLTHSHLWAERNLQKRWLLKSHPEALMGNLGLSGLLTEDIQRFRKLDDSSTPRPLLALGQMPNFHHPSRPTTTSLLAAATGESGELLRISRMEDSQWAWEDDKDTSLHLSVTDTMDQDDEVIWASDGLPISQVKYAGSSRRNESIRWLLVQKQTSTTVLRPEYHRVPTAPNHAYSKRRQRMSRVNPNPVLTLGHRETGGNAHSDVAFNPPSDDALPQLCVVDECGYWTLWNVSAASRTERKNLRLSLHRCGHVWEGALDLIPATPLYPAEKYGVLFVGAERSDDFWDETGAAAVSRSSHLLLWNSERFEVVNIETNQALPKMPGFSTARLKHDRILDVQLSPTNQNHAFILTARFIVWVDVLCPAKTKKGTVLRPAQLLSISHGDMSREGLRMTISRSTDGEDASPTVAVFSTTDSQVSMHWFSHERDGDLPHWHSQMTTISQNSHGESRSFFLQHMIFQPSKISSPSRASGIGARLRQDGVQFFQGTILGQDLSIQYCMCYASTNSQLQVTLPMSRLGWTKKEQNRRWKKKRLHLLAHLGNSVVIPDTMTEEVIASFSRREQGGSSGPHEISRRSKPRNATRPIRIDVEVLAGAIREFVMNPTTQAGIGLPSEVLDAFKTAVEQGNAEGRLPLLTWQEVAGDAPVDPERAAIKVEDVEEAVQDILIGTNDQTIVTQLTRRSTDAPEQKIGSLPDMHQQLTSVWLNPLKAQLSQDEVRLREAWLAELATDWFLSRHAITVQDAPLFGPASSGQLPDSQQSIPTSVAFPSSQPSIPTPTSSPPVSSAPGELDDAAHRLQLLALSASSAKMSATKSAKVLSLWPRERGVDTQGYVSSVAIASDKKLDPARKRLQRIEAKRKAMTDKYKRPRLVAQDLPEAQSDSIMPSSPVRAPAPTQIMSSQVPGSSQSHALPTVTMSQPMPGAFGGDRKKKVKAKAKKKSGFR